MQDDAGVLDFLKRQSRPETAHVRVSKENDAEREGEEDSCPAFGYLRGLRDRTQAIEFRFRNRDSEFFPYNLLNSWRFNPSAGLLLKFSGDVVTLVLIRGSNLDRTVNESIVNLPHGLQRHRIVWVREMDETEIRKIAASGPTIDRIEVAEFESKEEVSNYLKKMAPAFLRKSTTA